MFIRYFATIDDSPTGIAALAYLRSLLRIAPVRLIDPRGPMWGAATPRAWDPFVSCLTTPMDGRFINVVCTDPSQWAWTRVIDAPKKNEPGAEIEKITGTFELYTASAIRNVLIMPDLMTLPSNGHWLETADKYERLVTGTGMEMSGPRLWHVPYPVTLHAKLREAVTSDQLI
jgi:hypothetical protein